MKLFTKSIRTYPAFLFTERALAVGIANKERTNFSLLQEVALPDGLIQNDQVRDTAKLAAFLQNIRQQLNIVDVHVVVGISEVKATVKSLKLPLLSADEITQAVEEEADSFLPFRPHDEYIDWMLIEKLSDEEEYVLVSAVPKTIVDGFVRAFVQAGMQPVAFETTSLSLFRLLPADARRLSLTVELGDITTVLVLSVSGSIEVSSVIQESDNLLEKIQRLTTFYIHKKGAGKPPDSIYVCGSRATPQIARQIAQTLSMKPMLLSAPFPQLAEDKRIRYAVLASLALKRVAPPADMKTINILPEALSQKYSAEQEMAVERRVKMALLIIGIFLVGLNAFTMFFLQRAGRTVENSLSYLTTSQSSVTYEPNKVLTAQSVFTQHEMLADALREIAAVTSPLVSVRGTHFSAKDRTIIISGTAATRDGLLAFRDALAQKEIFTEVTIPFSSLEQERESEFRVVLKL
ncbi:MAG TPA: pilus assembly protein PilM [Patescibacteria group bacterium]|nr:pilus assembly protein PilM [Patescibacteria group bacterium]